MYQRSDEIGCGEIMCRKNESTRKQSSRRLSREVTPLEVQHKNLDRSDNESSDTLIIDANKNDIACEYLSSA